ncbi:DNA-binding transcriptional LysR family regulator [Pseudomonas marginalis]|uniref:LysR family transcriptional regulator n=1 Tax=Pseudomonas marginalis TaxID=298 RepID=UPI00209EA09E|nr:LysR family transcriptional regulator [Pseudomonas marginalis]MCP1507611.1 DNA-binding transcriptional LysR family regulator [Pseudomonas marginalis]MCP1525115.1 DNA-binding transcriptional LysR family regulator [Pseudomonas marginalis]MDQ0500290.1 DNA-binding transcriptional LysR family regulator [Pseudomonas marginalis]
MDKLLALKMFVQAVDSKGFSSAARQLGLATSSVTRMIDGLEAELGAVLLNRSTRQISLSDAGAAYYLKAREVLNAVAEADAAVTDRGELPAGHLRISVPVALGRRLIAPHIASLLKRYPQFVLDMTLSDDIVELLGARVDLAIRLGSAAAMDGVVSRPVGHFRRRVVASAEYLNAHGFPEHPMELMQHECLRFSYGPKQQVWTFLKEGEETRVPIEGRFKSNNAEVLREVALAGGGVALLPDWLVNDDIGSGDLTSLFEPFVINPNDASSAISALYLPNHRGSKRVNAFIEFISELLGPEGLAES